MNSKRWEYLKALKPSLGVIFYKGSSKPDDRGVNKAKRLERIRWNPNCKYAVWARLGK